MTPYAHCDDCGKSQYECVCYRILCRYCGETVVKREGEACSECLSSMAEYYLPDEGGNG